MIVKIAFRNIFRNKRRTVLTALSILGGFVLAAISIGWADGTYNNIIDLFTRNRTGHIQIHKKGYLERPTLYKTIDDLKSVSQGLKDMGRVEFWAPRVYSAGIVSVDEESTGAKIIGIEPDRENQMTHMKKKIVQGQYFEQTSQKEALLGKGLAQNLKAEIGNEVVIISQAADGSIANDLYRIIGIVESGDEMSDRTSLYLHICDAQDLFVLNDKVHEVAMTVGNLNSVRNVTKSLNQNLGDELKATPWQVFAKSFYVAMKADKEGMWIMLVVIILIVAVGVLNTVLMSVLERRREYGLLKAAGTRPFQIFRLVLMEVNILSLFCIIIGAGIGLVINSIMGSHGINLPNPISYGGMEIQSMLSEVNLRSFTIPAVSVFFTATLVSIFPAAKAARTGPAQSMRMH